MMSNKRLASLLACEEYLQLRSRDLHSLEVELMLLMLFEGSEIKAAKSTTPSSAPLLEDGMKRERCLLICKVIGYVAICINME